MRKVLIVSPHFPPINAPDMQRVRLSLPHLRATGWEPVVLAVAPESIEGAVHEPLLEDTYPADIRVIRVRGLPAKLTRWARIGSLWLRCARALRAAGDRLLATEKFDLVFFSTTQFGAFTLGPRWKQRFGIPYVLDYQDPWFTDYYRRTGAPPPGGRFKFALAQLRARIAEPRVLREAAEVIAVSPAYGPMLARLCPTLDASRVRVIPFGASAGDIETARGQKPAELLVPFEDGCVHHVYAGRCGPDMAVALGVLFRAFKLYLARRPEEARRVRFHFIGTDYAPPPLGRETVMPVARAEGVAEYVREFPRRVPYFDALHHLAKADALVVVGSDDPSYSASKIYPYVLARRPLLAIFHGASPVLSFLHEVGAGEAVGFESQADIDRLAESVCLRWFEQGRMLAETAPDLTAFAPYSAERMTLRLSEVFDSATKS